MNIAHVSHTKSLDGNHPFGEFWGFDKKNDCKIDRESLYSVAYKLGFRLFNKDIVRIEGIFIYDKKDSEFYDELKTYISLQQPDLYNDVCNCYEAFIQKAGTFTISRLRNLETIKIISDKPQSSYKFFENCFIEIDCDGRKIHQYDEVKNQLIWAKNIIQRQWTDDAPEHFKYSEFLQLAVGITPQLMKVIGYLSHDYKGEDTGYIITLTEQCPDPKGGGGSGKNVFGNLLRLNTSMHTVSGSQVQMNEKFLQSWRFQRIMFLADVPKRFDFSFLKEISTGHGTLKRLFKDEISIPPEEMPKLLINTNFSFDATDGGLKRRIIPIEFTEFFTACGGVDVHFGCMFPNGWTEQDYIGYDHFISLCLTAYFKSDGKLRATELSEGGWIKQFQQRFGEFTYNFIKEGLIDWTVEKEISVTKFNYQYEDFVRINNIAKKFELSAIMMNRAIEEYCHRYDIFYNKSHVMKDSNNNTFKAKLFEKLVTNS